jgi:serine/threonine protein phosphatase PrpC/nitrate reductase NapE component
MRVRVGAKSDIGRARERNEDSLLLSDPLFAVADGMGGHKGGNVASAMALETLEEAARAGQLSELVEKVKEANVHVLGRGEAERDLQGMGTTLTAVKTDGTKAYLVHIGDSRAYLLRDGALQQLTQDHTLVQRMVDEGRLTKEEAEHHPQRSILTRALGVDADAEPDPLTLDLLAGDRLLLCTDGLTGMVGVDRIHEIIEGEPDPQVAADRLVDAANEAGGEDNITVIVLDFEQDEDGSDQRTAAIPANASGTDGGPTSQAISGSRSSVTVVGRPLVGHPAPERGQAAPKRGRRRWRRFAIWTAALIVVLALALVGVRVYVDRQWFVGDTGERVAIYNGIPTKVLAFDLSRVRETTNLSAAAAERLAPWRGLHDGITAESLADARSIVQQIRRDLQVTKAGG